MIRDLCEISEVQYYNWKSQQAANRAWNRGSPCISRGHLFRWSAHIGFAPYEVWGTSAELQKPFLDRQSQVRERRRILVFRLEVSQLTVQRALPQVEYYRRKVASLVTCVSVRIPTAPPTDGLQIDTRPEVSARQFSWWHPNVEVFVRFVAFRHIIEYHSCDAAMNNTKCLRLLASLVRL